MRWMATGLKWKASLFAEKGHQMVAVLALSPKIELKTRKATRDAWRGKSHLWKVDSTQQTTNPAPPATQTAWHKFPENLCCCCCLCYSTTNFFVARSVCWFWSKFAKFISSPDTSLLPIIMPVTRSRNGSRNPSRGASPVLRGDDNRSSSEDLLLLLFALRVLGCRRHLLRRSLLLSLFRLPW